MPKLITPQTPKTPDEELTGEEIDIMSAWTVPELRAIIAQYKAEKNTFKEDRTMKFTHRPALSKAVRESRENSAKLLQAFKEHNPYKNADNGIYGLECQGQKPEPRPLMLYCPKCYTQHIDEGEWATRPHKTHQCQQCKYEWCPLEHDTIGVRSMVAVRTLPE